MMTKPDDLSRLAAWLEDYALYRGLADPEDVPDAPAESEPPDFAGEPPPEQGQIRLWMSRLTADPPLYGLLLFAGYGEWWVLPFSPLALPAVPSEYLLRGEGPARVLEGWNRRRTRSAEAAASWCVDRTAEEELFPVQAWLLAVEAGQPPPDGVSDRVGPPLRHPLDPRHEYLDAEAERVDNRLAEPGAVYETGADRLAAEPGAAYRSRIWTVGRTGVELTADPAGVTLPAADPWREGARLEGEGGVCLRLEGERTAFPGAGRVAWLRLRAGETVWPLRPTE